MGLKMGGGAGEKWMLAAAEQGLAEAQFELGARQIRQGQPWSALQWIEVSARAGHAGAQAQLARWPIGLGAVSHDLSDQLSIVYSMLLAAR